MRFAFSKIVVCVLSVCVISAVNAEDSKKKKKEPDFSKHAVMRVFKLPATIELAAEQKVKMDELKKEFEPALKEVAKKQDSILTGEQRAARKTAAAAAKAAGKKGKEAQTEIAAAVKLTDEQKKQQEELAKEVKEIHGKIREKMNTFLTADQQAKLKSNQKKAKTAA